MEEALRGGCLSCDLYGSNAYDAGPPQGKNRVAATSNPEQNSGKEYAAHADATSNVASQPSARKSLPEKRIRPSAVAPLVVDTAAYDRSESAEEMVQAPRSPIASKRASNPDLSAHNRSSDPGNGNPRGLLGKFAEQMEKVALHGVTLEFNTPATFAGLMTVVAATFQITFYNMVLVESASHLGIGLSAIHFSSQIAGGYRASHRDAHDHLNLRSLDRASLAGFILVIANLVLLLATVVSLLMPRVSGWVFERRNTFVVLSLVGFVAVLIPGYWVVHSFFTAAHTLRLSLALSVVIAIVLRSCKMWGSRWVTPNLVGVPVAIVAGVVSSRAPACG